MKERKTLPFFALAPLNLLNADGVVKIFAYLKGKSFFDHAQKFCGERKKGRTHKGLQAYQIVHIWIVAVNWDLSSCSWGRKGRELVDTSIVPHPESTFKAVNPQFEPKTGHFCYNSLKL